jgi:hypothetical protein
MLFFFFFLCCSFSDLHQAQTNSVFCKHRTVDTGLRRRVTQSSPYEVACGARITALLISCHSQPSARGNQLDFPGFLLIRRVVENLWFEIG